MYILNDIAHIAGICWRYADRDAPDHDATYNLKPGETDPTPSRWTTWEVEERNKPSIYIQTNGHHRVVLLEDYTTHPTPTARKNQALGSQPTVVIRSCVDPIDKLLKQRVDGIAGAICFVYYQGAQRTESLVRTAHGFVSTHAEFPLNEGQCALAQEIWPHALRLRFAQAADKERHQIVCDSVDEMPNMADV